MAKVLLTGMSAPQASLNANNRSMGFAGLIGSGLNSFGDEVVWSDPSISFSPSDVENYDAVLVGLSPVTSLGANRVYGALNVIDVVWKTSPEKLTLFIDAPNVSQIEVSLRAVLSNPENFTKEFYSYRKNYLKVASDEQLQKRLLSVVENLVSKPWPTTIYPKLPWMNDVSVVSKLPAGAANSFYGVNLDSIALVDSPTTPSEGVHKWSSDNVNSSWVKTTSNTLSFPCFPMKVTKTSTDDDVSEQISRSVGVLIAPDKKQNTWWTYRYIQAMNTLTPIATNWEETHELDSSWAILAAGIESAGLQSRTTIASAQREAYLRAIPDRIEAIDVLRNILKLK